jgi:RimJ/RimL family protein N-acetyltransferase
MKGMVVDYLADHLVQILREKEPGEEYEENHSAYAASRTARGPALSIYSEEKELIACCGVALYWPTSGMVWAVFSSKAFANMVVFTRGTRQILDYFQISLGIVRLQADVLADNASAQNYVRHYGFTEEGLMRSFDPEGRDVIRFARIRGVRP